MNVNIPYISREQTEALLNCFAEAIEKPASQPLLFNVWGIGGVGKTTLLDKLQEQNPNVGFARVYFGSTPDISTPLKLMANLYRQLPVISGWSEEFTDLYKQYEQTLEQLDQPKHNESEAQAKERKEAVKELKERCKNIATGISKSVPVIKNISESEQIVGSLAEAGVDLALWLQKQKVTKKDKELQALMLNPIPKLTKAFVRGLIAKSQRQPVVLLLDTYEKTNSEIDNWLWQYLIANSSLKSHAVRVVVAGRKNLLKQESWRKLQQDFSSVYSLEIERFNLEQTQHYLEDIFINQSEEIHQVTKGLPYYLDWIRKQKLAGKELDFSQGNQEIVNLLLQGLNKEQQKLIQLAACCRWFDQSLMRYLVTSQELDFDNAVDTELNCFEWLEKLDFVEFSQNTHRLDDVARDVFRLSLWQEDEEQFRQVNDLLAKYYEAKAIEELSPDSSPRQMYENLEWKECIAESLYHTLLAKQKDCERKFLAHLFTSCYLQETEVVIIPFNAITAEVDIDDKDNILLSSSVKKFLKNLKPIFDVNCLAFEEQKLVDSLNVQELSLEQVKTSLKTALEYCFSRINSLDGLAKFAALLYKAKNSPSSYQLKYLQQAKSQAENIIVNSDPEFSCGLFLWGLGNAFFGLHKWEKAIASYDKALEIKPDYDVAWYKRGVALSNLDRYKEAITSYDKALEIKPDYHEAWLNRGFALGRLDRDEEAISSYDRAFEIKPDDHEAWYNRGFALLRLDRDEEAISSYDRALEIKPDNGQAWYIRGLTLGNLDRHEEAISSYDRALEIKPDDHEAWFNRGITLRHLGRYEEAIASYDKALELNPDNEQAWDHRGINLFKLGRYEEAIASYNKALEIKPDYHDAWYNRACCFALQNQIEPAIENLVKAISLDNKYQEMAKTDSDFDNIREDTRFKSLIKNKIHLLSKAQIGLDALQPQDQKKATKIIESLEDFPSSNILLNARKIDIAQNKFIAKLGRVYRIIFQYQNNEVIITDILSRDRLHRLPIFFKQEV